MGAVCASISGDIWRPAKEPRCLTRRLLPMTRPIHLILGKGRAAKTYNTAVDASRSRALHLNSQSPSSAQECRRTLRGVGGGGGRRWQKSSTRSTTIHVPIDSPRRAPHARRNQKTQSPPLDTRRATHTLTADRRQSHIPAPHQLAFEFKFLRLSLKADATSGAAERL